MTIKSASPRLKFFSGYLEQAYLVGAGIKSQKIGGFLKAFSDGQAYFPTGSGHWLVLLN